MTVEENIGFGLDSSNKAERFQKISKMISMMNLEGFEKRYPNQLSGGQQQRVALARALAVEPEALFLDEPFSALDGHLRNYMGNQLISLLSGYKGVTLFVTHDMEEAYNICDNLIILSGGGKVASGGKEEIFEAPPTLAAAQLIGCKNLSEARRVSSRIVEALQWGCKLNTGREIKDILNVGIHAHNIRLANEKDKENVFPCWFSYTRETPFHVTIYLHIGSPPHKAMDYHIQWEVSMEQWLCVKDLAMPLNICLDPKKLILIGEE
jgi:ABC-type sulfate/molybdate transport systems ATPase subunit